MKKGFAKSVISSMVAISLFATPVFAAGGTVVSREKESNNTMSTASSHRYNTSYDEFCLFGSLNNPKDTDDWFKVQINTDIKGIKKINTNIFFEGTSDSSYEVTVLDNNENMRGYKIVPGGGSMRLDDIMVTDEQYLYFHIKHKDGNPIMPYMIQIFKNGLY